MKLTGRSIAWTVVAAVVTVWTIHLLMSLASDARAMFLGIVAGVVIVCTVAWLSKYLLRRDVEDDEIETPAYRAAVARQMDMAAAFAAGRDHAAWRLSLGDPEYMPAQQPPAVQPVVQEVHYHYHAAQGQQQGVGAINGREV